MTEAMGRRPLAMLTAQVVDATPEHIEEIAAVYAAVVRDSPATFDLEAPGVDWWTRVLERRDPEAGHHLLVALDSEGSVLGYVKSGEFMERPAYSSTCLVSAYIAEGARGKGVGTALYSVLLERLDASDLRLAVAGITEPNPASTALHRSFGFERVGTFEDVGVKFGRAWSVTWYQRPLGAPALG
jgi:L-amino acid N-acyltransferase YncA